MMFSQSSIRNQRAKSSKVKRILQFTLLLGVSLWLLYQMKHSHDKNAEYEEVERRRISQLDRELYLGRKGKAGHESELEIDNHEKKFDENNEISKTDEDSGAQPDVVFLDGGDKDEENASNKENEVSQEAGKEEEQRTSEYDNTDSHSTNVVFLDGGDKDEENASNKENEVSQEAGKEEEQRTSEYDNTNSHSTNVVFLDGGDKDEENASNKENEVSQEAGKEEEQRTSEYDNTDSHSTNGGDQVAGNGTGEETEETLKLPGQDEDGNNNYSDQNENSNEVDSHDGRNLNTAGVNSDDAASKVFYKENTLTSVSLPEDQSKLDVSSNEQVHVGESGESQRSNDSESEFTNKRTDEEVDAGASNNKQPTQVNPSEENNSMPTFNDTSNEQTIEPQRDNVNADSENENHEIKTAEPQSDNNADVVTTVSDLSGEAKIGNENNVETAMKDGALDSKLAEPEGNNDVNPIAEVATNNGDNKEEDGSSAIKEGGDSAEKVGENASEVETFGDSSSNEPENNEITNTEDSSSSHKNEEDILERKANESFNGETGEKGEGVSTVENTNDNNAEEIKPEDETSSESGSNLPLSGDNVKEGTGQDGRTE